MVRYRRILAS